MNRRLHYTPRGIHSLSRTSPHDFPRHHRTATTTPEPIFPNSRGIEYFDQLLTDSSSFHIHTDTFTMSSFSVFEHAHKKATRNGRSRPEAVTYALNKYFLDLCDSLDLRTDEETQECVVKEGVEAYRAAGRAGDTHDEAAKDATNRIKRMVKDAIRKDGGKSRPEKIHTSSHRPKRKPLDDYEDMFESLPKLEPCRSHTDHSSHAHTGRRPSHHDDDDHHHTPVHSHASRPTAGHHGSHSYAGHSGRQAPPMPAGTGRFNFPEPEYRDDRTGPARSNTTQECRPSTGHVSGGRSYSTNEYRPSDARKPSGPSRLYTTEGYRPSAGGWSGFSSNAPSGGHHYSGTDGSKGYEWSSTSYSKTSYSYDQAPHTHSSSYSSTGPSPHSPPPRSHSYQTYEPSGSQHNDHSRPPPRSYHTFEPSEHSKRPPTPPPPADRKPPMCFYKVLGIPRTATEEDIKTAYRKLSLGCHPDRPTGSTEKMAELNQANDVLSDLEKRKYHDTTGCVPFDRNF
jgi:hypothetical protein